MRRATRRRRYDWRAREYRALSHLHADFTLASFERSLGPPLIQQDSDNRKWTQYVFQGRDYWAQVITRRGSSNVGFYAVTSCSTDFHPKFVLTGGGAIILNTA